MRAKALNIEVEDLKKKVQENKVDASSNSSVSFEIVSAGEY